MDTVDVLPRDRLFAAELRTRSPCGRRRDAKDRRAFDAALAAEPMVLVLLRGSVLQGSTRDVRWAVAATIAAVTVVGWTAFSMVERAAQRDRQGARGRDDPRGAVAKPGRRTSRASTCWRIRDFHRPWPSRAAAPYFAPRLRRPSSRGAGRSRRRDDMHAWWGPGHRPGGWGDSGVGDGGAREPRVVECKASRRSGCARDPLRARLNYSGTILVRRGARFRHVSAGAHVRQRPGVEKLLSLDGPAREIVRSATRGSLLLPDVKVVRIEPRTIRNVFVVSPEQTSNLAQYYDTKLTPGGRVAGRHRTDWRDVRAARRMRYAHRFWADATTACCCVRASSTRRARSSRNSRSTDVTYNAKLAKEMVRLWWTSVPFRWQVTQAVRPTQEQRNRWTVTQVPRLIQSSEASASLRASAIPPRTSCFRRPRGHLGVRGAVYGRPTQIGLTQAGGLPNIRREAMRIALP